MRARGLTKLIPDFSVLSDTVPKKSTTPTLPAGMTVKQFDNAATKAPNETIKEIFADPFVLGLMRMFCQEKNAAMATMIKIKKNIEPPISEISVLS